VFEPFSEEFEKRSELLLEDRKKKIAKIIASEKELRKFRAQPLPEVMHRRQHIAQKNDSIQVKHRSTQTADLNIPQETAVNLTLTISPSCTIAIPLRWQFKIVSTTWLMNSDCAVCCVTRRVAMNYNLRYLNCNLQKETILIRSVLEMGIIQNFSLYHIILFSTAVQYCKWRYTNVTLRV